MQKLISMFVLVLLAGCSQTPTTEIDTNQGLDTELTGTVEAQKSDTEPIIKSQRPLVAETAATPVLETKSVVSKLPGEDSVHSFKTFLEKGFVGTDFTVGNLLTDWGTHKSYFATYSSNGLKISGTWHVPNGVGPFPVLILNHGYFPPETYTNGYGFGREQKYFAGQGYAVFHTDYRGYAFSDPAPENQRLWGDLGAATDAINAGLAIKNANLDFIDNDNMGLFGHSLGGGVALNAALAKPDLFKVGVMWGPVSSNYWDNFNQWRREGVTSEQIELFEETFGSIDDEKSFTALSAFPYLDRLEVPLLIQHGTADESCPVEWSQFTFQELQRLGKNAEYIEYDGYPHVFWNENWNIAIEDANDYIENFLK